MDFNKLDMQIDFILEVDKAKQILRNKVSEELCYSTLSARVIFYYRGKYGT